MSVCDRQHPEMSSFSICSGILTSNIRPIYAMVEFPNVYPGHPLSSRDRP
jgi:hypothetical protein